MSIFCERKTGISKDTFSNASEVEPVTSSYRPAYLAGAVFGVTTSMAAASAVGLVGGAATWLKQP